MSVSLILTTFNEESAIDELLVSVARQTRRPDEVVVVDGGSRDGTVARLYAWKGELPLRVLIRPGANISAGRNAAIGAARGDIIAVTDAGVRLEPDWLERLVQPIEAGAAGAAAGFFAADPRSRFEIAMGATVLPRVEEIDPAKFLPSSRSVAFRRDLWARAGGYPDWLDYCEDLIFDLALRRAGGAFAWVPAAVAHFRPRSNLRSFFLQYYRYARGDGKAGLYLRRHLIRYASYLGAAALAALALRGGGWRKAALALALPAGVAVHTYRPYRRLARLAGKRRPAEWLALALLVPLIRFTGDAAKMLGYPVGVVWRLRRSRFESRPGAGRPPHLVGATPAAGDQDSSWARA